MFAAVMFAWWWLDNPLAWWQAVVIGAFAELVVRFRYERVSTIRKRRR